MRIENRENRVMSSFFVVKHDSHDSQFSEVLIVWAESRLFKRFIVRRGERGGEKIYRNRFSNGLS